MKPAYVFYFLAGSVVLFMRTSTEAAKLFLDLNELEAAESNLADVLKDADDDDDDEEDADYAENNGLTGDDLKDENDADDDDYDDGDKDKDENEADEEGVESYTLGEEDEGEDDDDEAEGVDSQVDDTPMNKAKSDPGVFAETMEYVQEP